jgi:hypothetical protein
MPGERQFAPGVKMRIAARFSGTLGLATKTVSDRLNSRAIACIAAVSSPSESSTTASGLPAFRFVVKTSSVAKRRFMVAILGNLEVEVSGQWSEAFGRSQPTRG